MKGAVQQVCCDSLLYLKLYNKRNFKVCETLKSGVYLSVNKHFEGEHNAEITLLDSSFVRRASNANYGNYIARRVLIYGILVALLDNTPVKHPPQLLNSLLAVVTVVDVVGVLPHIYTHKRCKTIRERCASIGLRHDI